MTISLSAKSQSSRILAEKAGGGMSPSATSFPNPLGLGGSTLGCTTSAPPRPAIRDAQPGAAQAPAAPGDLQQPVTRGAVRSINLGGVKCRYLSFPYVQKPAKPARGISKCFDWFLWLFVHDEQPTERNLSCVTSLMSRVAKCQ